MVVSPLLSDLITTLDNNIEYSIDFKRPLTERKYRINTRPYNHAFVPLFYHPRLPLTAFITRKQTRKSHILCWDLLCNVYTHWLGGLRWNVWASSTPPPPPPKPGNAVDVSIAASPCGAATFSNEKVLLFFLVGFLDIPICGAERVGVWTGGFRLPPGSSYSPNNCETTSLLPIHRNQRHVARKNKYTIEALLNCIPY